MKFKEYLVELFDKPWSAERVKDISDQLNSAKADGKTNHHFYKLEGENGFLHTFKKDGYTEIHHIAANGMTGIISDISSGKSGANPRFYSTMINHAKQHLEKGHGIKISAPQHLLKHYRILTNKFKDQYKIEQHSDHILIRPHKKEVEEMFNSIKHFISSGSKDLTRSELSRNNNILVGS